MTIICDKFAAFLRSISDGKCNFEADPGPILLASLARAQINLAGRAEVSTRRSFGPPDGTHSYLRTGTGGTNNRATELKNQQHRAAELLRHLSPNLTFW